MKENAKWIILGVAFIIGMAVNGFMPRQATHSGGNEAVAAANGAEVEVSDPATGDPNAVYIASGGHGSSGMRIAVVRDGGTASKFDAIISSLGVTNRNMPTCITLGPGTFETEKGIPIFANWTLKGSGMFVTTLKIVNTGTNSIGGVYTSNNDIPNPGGQTVSDLTIDANWSPGRGVRQGVGLWGSNCTIDHVRCIHPGATGGEEISFVEGGYSYTQTNNCKMTNCIADDCMTDGVDAFAFMNPSANNYPPSQAQQLYSHGLEEAYNYVGNGGPFAFSQGVDVGAGTDCCLIHDNVVVGAHDGTYLDSYNTKNVHIYNNCYLQITGYGVCTVGGYVPGFDGFFVDNNLIEITQAAQGILIYNPSNLNIRNVAIRNNRIRNAVGVTNTNGILLTGSSYLIQNYIPGDDFANVGGVNGEHAIFAATGSAPRNWTHGSALQLLLVRRPAPGISCDIKGAQIVGNILDKGESVVTGTVSNEYSPQLKQYYSGNRDQYGDPIAALPDTVSAPGVTGGR